MKKFIKIKDKDGGYFLLRKKHVTSVKYGLTGTAIRLKNNNDSYISRSDVEEIERLLQKKSNKIIFKEYFDEDAPKIGETVEIKGKKYITQHIYYTSNNEKIVNVKFKKIKKDILLELPNAISREYLAEESPKIGEIVIIDGTEYKAVDRICSSSKDHIINVLMEKIR